jgi:hypothetical protein
MVGKKRRSTRPSRFDPGAPAPPLRGGSEHLRGCAKAGRDISDREQAEDLIQRQLARFAALRTIDTASMASLDVRVTLNILLDQIIAHLQVDAADVLLFSPHTQTLDFGAERGFSTRALQRPGRGRGRPRACPPGGALA